MSMRRLTMRDVAIRAGVSLGTVSNVFNRPDLVADETREQVRRATEDLGFVRNGAARQLRGGRGAAIGLVVLDAGNPFFAEVARGVEDAARASGYLVIVCSSAGDSNREDQQLRLLEEQRVAGILLSPSRRGRSQLHDQIKKRGTSIVLLDHPASVRDQCSVAVDNVTGGGLAGRHLAELGHTHFALINGPHKIKQCAQRRKGFLESLASAGLSLEPTNEVEMEQMTIATGEAAAQRLLRRRVSPTAIFCTNDLLALGAERAVIAAGGRVPGDVAIVGYDDVVYAAMAFVPLTTIRQPAYKLGYHSTQLILEETMNPQQHRHQHLVFSPELIIRDSTVPSHASSYQLSNNRPGRLTRTGLSHASS
jgi:LacI family transcriptional regulator